MSTAGEALGVILAVILIIGIAGGAIWLMVATALFVISVGVPAWIVWGWFALICLSGLIRGVAAAGS